MSGPRGGVVWFSGLSGSGKTTLARRLKARLDARGRRSFVLDGDVLRTGINADLGFSEEARVENLRRVTEVARLFAEAGLVALVSAIAPYESSRRAAAERIGLDRFILVHVATPLSVCEARDVKGLYRKARSGQLCNFTGIDAPYEDPEHPDLRLVPEGDPDAGVDLVLRAMTRRGLVSAANEEMTDVP